MNKTIIRFFFVLDLVLLLFVFILNDSRTLSVLSVSRITTLFSV